MKPNLKIMEADDLPKLTNIPAVVLGNGPSRLFYDITVLRGRCVVFGCNRIFQDWKFRDAPFFFGACDDTIFEMLRNKRDYLLDNPLIVPASHHYLTEFNLPFIRYFKGEDWENTGSAMLKAAILLGCSPIFILGFSDDSLPSRDGYCINVYSDDIRKTQLRYTRELDTANSVIESFHKGFIEVTKKYPRSLFRIGDHGSLLRHIPYVDWNDLIKSLPQKYAREPTSLDAPWAPWRIREV